MLITPGNWTGRGRYLHEGQSLGTVVELHFQVTHDQYGEHLEGTLTPEGSEPREFSVRVLENDTGTFEITATGMSPQLAGVGKLESEPNMAHLVSDSESDANSSASVALFSTGRGVGCRGFWQRPVGVLTWEIVLTRSQATRLGGNVVALRRR